MTRETSADGGRAAGVLDGARRQFDRWSQTYDRSWLNELVFFPGIRFCLEQILTWQAARTTARFDALDVGCGTGTFLMELSRLEWAGRLAGLDYSPEMVRRAGERAASSGLGERVQFTTGDAESPPFADGSFDVLTCANSFHHYPNQAAVVAAFRRVLRPGGLLVIVDGFRDNVVGWVIFDLAVATAERNVHHASWSEMRRHCEAAGFSDIRQQKRNVLAPLLITTARA
ncbi:MAG: methyltransferase domain-containing protein [Phycisphaerales bacterium]|nr:methyltransferase domain-containing protein [Phycisphaerales bacterium]